MTFSKLPTVDILIFLIGNLVNILISAIMISRTSSWKKFEFYSGLIIVTMAIPLAACVYLNFIENRGVWTVILPLFLIVYCLIELIFDYIFKSNFRETNLLWPYLLVFYLALMGMIGYAFLLGKPFGFITLSTYFLSLFATRYSYTRVGH
ncbi:MAG: hypothetical protein DWQ05_02560 [Calditrichaeota bacterium]|nr:MAG: hypothetical protein DWQ05_02560 [Calditrichota bacterium]